MVSPLRKRDAGFELSSIEKYNIFEKENQGYVRYRSTANHTFFLDPSPWEDSPKSEVFVCLSEPYPPKGKLIEVIVREAEDSYNFVRDSPIDVKKTVIKYVSGWNLVDPKKLRLNRNMYPEEFTSILSEPIKKCYFKEDLGFSLAMYLVSSPRLSDFEPGGINTVVMANRDQAAWGFFSRTGWTIPSIFKRPTAKNYYVISDVPLDLQPNLNAEEINCAHFNVPSVPVHIPLPLSVEFKPYNEQLEHFKFATPITRAYMLDSILFQPDLSDRYSKLIEDTMYDIIHETRDKCWSVYLQDYGDLLQKLSTSFARIKFHQDVERADIKESMETWLTMSATATKTQKYRREKEDASPKTALEHIILSELHDMRDTGVELTVTNLRQRLTCSNDDFERSFERLRRGGLVYVYGEACENIGLVDLR